ncbi:MAG TPA: RNA 2',3'-cyclic phosphodiesterase [Acidiferrobacteraceae bacterium]|nr:RNA 2',3'-cyclic phosphodiesterase [Acidiferrobacteraceae bacterium]
MATRPVSSQFQRVFLALWPDVEQQQSLAQVAHDCVTQCKGRPTVAANIHMTLVFVGAVTADQLDQVIQVACSVDIRSFGLHLDRLGWWPRPKIVWVGCGSTPPALLAWVTQLRDGLGDHGFRVESRPFQAHVSLVRKARCLPQLDFKGIDWSVNQLCLVRSHLESQGGHYEVLQRWPALADGAESGLERAS